MERSSPSAKYTGPSWQLLLETSGMTRDGLPRPCTSDRIHDMVWPGSPRQTRDMTWFAKTVHVRPCSWYGLTRQSTSEQGHDMLCPDRARQTSDMTWSALTVPSRPVKWHFVLCGLGIRIQPMFAFVRDVRGDKSWDVNCPMRLYHRLIVYLVFLHAVWHMSLDG